MKMRLLRCSIWFVAVIVSLRVSAQVQWFYDVPYHEVEGVDPNLLSLDVGVPEQAQAAPVLIYVHGGGWVTGDKSNLVDKGTYFTSQGWIFVSINYRLSPFPYELDNPDRLMFPTHTADVARAVAFVLDRVGQYGGDVDKVSLMGHSTGAHLVSQIATDQSYLGAYGYDPSDLRCVCSNDIAGYDIGTWLDTDIANDSLYFNAFGTDASIWDIASPQQQVDAADADMPDLLVIKRGQVARQQQADDFYDRVSLFSGSRVDILSADPLSHAEVNQLIGDTSTVAGLELTTELSDWLQPCRGTATSVSGVSSTLSEVVVVSASYIRTLVAGTVVLVDFAGRPVYRADCQENTVIDHLQLPTGMYVLRFHANDEVWTTKFLHSY